MLTKADILAADDFQTESVEVPEWGGTVLLRVLSAADAMQLAQSAESGKVSGEMAGRWLVKSIVDDKGERLFQDSDAKTLAGKSFRVVQQLFEKLLTLNGLTDDSQKALEKN